MNEGRRHHADPAGGAPHQLSLTQAAEDVRAGRITSAELVYDCLKRIKAFEPEVQAWTYLDPDHAMRQAEAADAHRRQGRALGPLHGIPIGVKDIFDTADMPTEFGTPIWAGRRPRADATAIAWLRAAGAVIMGKTVTTEFAYYSSGKTRNPHDPQRTPGGSSSGSAAAVAAAMVPATLGSQTNGSVIRPASFCGVVGYKPTHGLIPRTGVLPLSRTLDQMGVFTRTIEDAALLAETLIGFDGDDPDTRPIARPQLAAAAASPTPRPPRFAFVRSPVWPLADVETHAAFEGLVASLGAHVAEVELDARLAAAFDLHHTIMAAEMAHNLHPHFEKGGDLMSATLHELIARGREVRAVDYLRAVAEIGPLNAMLDALFDAYDAIITPAAPGPAPRGLQSTGNPIFCTLWTYLGVPALSLPLLASQDGLPIGVQLVGRRHDDARLLRSAKALVAAVSG